MAPVRMGVPAVVTIPMAMHIGAPAKPVVKAGDTVMVGQLIGEASGFVSSPVYASVSGKVKKIDEILASNGASVQAVVIESDGEQRVHESVQPRTVNSREELLEAMKNSGIVGLGGAGFPTTVKLAADAARMDTLVINGAECEPYITSDTRTMLDDAELVAEGIALLLRCFEIPHAILGVENNKPQCITKMREALSSVTGAVVKSLPAKYPQGGEKVLIYHTTGRTVEEGKLPIDVGVLLMNCTTIAAIARFIKTGMPLVEKCVTVDGSAVKEPKNVIVPIGTPIREIFDFCGGFREEPKKVLFGGPMMGIAAPNLDAPLTKQNNAVLAFGAKEATPPKQTACIKCGRCIQHCPFSLSPCEIEKAYEAKDGAALARLKVNLCMECGCCSYVCPAKRNIVQKNKLAKAMLRQHQMAEKGGK